MKMVQKIIQYSGSSTMERLIPLKKIYFETVFCKSEKLRNWKQSFRKFYFWLPINSYPHLAANLPLNAVFTMETFFLQVWHPGSSSVSRANFSRHVLSYIRHFRALSRSARKTGSKNAKNRKNRVSARYHCNSSQRRLRFGLTHQIRNVARFSVNILWNFQPWLQSKTAGEIIWFKLWKSDFFRNHQHKWSHIFTKNDFFWCVFFSQGVFQGPLMVFQWIMDEAEVV